MTILARRIFFYWPSIAVLLPPAPPLWWMVDGPKKIKFYFSLPFGLIPADFETKKYFVFLGMATSSTALAYDW